MGKLETMRELIGYLISIRRYWLIPLGVIIVVLAILVFVATVLGPLLYPFI